MLILVIKWQSLQAIRVFLDHSKLKPHKILKKEIKGKKKNLFMGKIGKRWYCKMR